MGGSVMDLDMDSFTREVEESALPVLVDFWAEWCGPCKMMAPVIDDLADDLEGKLKVCKVNVEDNRDLASSNEVKSIPTLILFINGEVKERFTGYISREELLDRLDPYVNNER